MKGTFYRDFSEYLTGQFPDFKVQKISINAGFTCPNRDGSKGRGGCTYCNNQSFSPSYTMGRASITSQLESGKGFFSRKYPNMKYLAYFQSYSNTYGDLSSLKAMYEEALRVHDVVGIIIGTRPDCVSEPLLDYLQELSKEAFVYIEYGVESTSDATLMRVNRGHTFAESAWAIMETDRRNIPVGAHIIVGLPGERQEDYITHIGRLSSLPITSIKLHQLQVLKGTVLAKEYIKHPFSLYSMEAYADMVCTLLRYMRPTIYVDRFVSQSPQGMLVAPKWGVKNYQFTYLVEQKMHTNSWHQGDLYRRNLQ